MSDTGQQRFARETLTAEIFLQLTPGRPEHALSELTSRAHWRPGWANCRSSHVRNAPATVSPKKAACRDGLRGDCAMDAKRRNEHQLFPPSPVFIGRMFWLH